jgi:hypothetical protein
MEAPRTLMNMSNSTTPTTTDILLPTVRNLEEARLLSKNFGSVLTAGPQKREVNDFNHPDHKVVSFDDVVDERWGMNPPTYEHVKEMIEWGQGRQNLLVHCHAGISRSTATAWGIAISNGFNEEEAFHMLKSNHPTSKHRGWESSKLATYRRTFSPNELIVQHLEKLFGFKTNTLTKILISSYGDDDELFLG